MDVVRRRRDHPAPPDLQLVHGRDDQRARSDEARAGRDRELEVREAATLAEAGAVLTHRDRPADDEVDGIEVGDVDRYANGGGAAYRAGGARGGRQSVRIEKEERLLAGEARDRHVQGLAVLEGALANRPLG